MPVSTTLKLPEQLKKRLASLAKSAGKTPHAWMIEALETQATLAEKRRGFIDDARAAEKEVEETGEGPADIEVGVESLIDKYGLQQVLDTIARLSKQ